MFRAIKNYHHPLRLICLGLKRNTWEYRSLENGELLVRGFRGRSSIFSSRASTGSSSSSSCVCYRSPKLSDGDEAARHIIPRRMSSAASIHVPAIWRKFMTNFQETRTQHDGLARFFINSDISYGEFNKYGRFNPWCMLDHFEASIHLFLTELPDSEHLSLFARNVEVNFKEGTEGRIQFEQALKFKICLTYLGKSTVCWEAQCLDVETDEELANYSIQMVTVDMNERKPTPAANLFKEFCPQNLREFPPKAFDLEFKPEQTFQHEFVVNWSDTDFNSHLNQADMCRMCVDCGSFAAVQNRLSAFHRELVTYDQKRCSFLFLKDARPGDRVLVECWESEDNPLVLNFAFSKENEVITMIQMEYFSGDIAA
nr:uncharacterized protein LOC129256557 [Lytechinus pictus]